MRRLYWAVTWVGIVLTMPLTALAGDQETAERIRDNLASSGKMKDYSVGVKVQEGTAWLKGTVANREQMTAALMTAHETHGIDRVVNNLTIAPSRGAGPTRPQTYANKPGRLRQPEGVAASFDQGRSTRRGRVVRASMELPEHAQAELMVPGPMADVPDDMPASDEPRAYPPEDYDAAMPLASPQGRQPVPLPIGARGPYQQVSQHNGGEMIGTPQPMTGAMPLGTGAPAPMHYDSPSMPNYAWPSYAAYPNYAALTYPKQYSPTAWPYIGPFYPYPQVPLGWRKVTMEWKDGWWFLDFKDSH